MSRRYIEITKLREADNPSNPGDRPPGEKHWGYNDQDPKAGDMFHLYGISNQSGMRGFRTSRVQEILSENTFRTHNSIYEWKVITPDQIPGRRKEDAYA